MPKFAGSQARAIGAEMRRARDSLEWTLETLAAATDISRSTLSRIETGARRADVGEAASILTALAVTGPAKQRLLRLAGEGAGTWVEIGPAMEQQLSAIAAYESEARSISDFQISVVPGLLQTSAYARDLIGTSPLGTASRDRAARTRIARQSALNRPALSDYRAFIDEAALRRRVGADPRTMTDQLRKLVETVQRPGLEVRVVPFSSGAYWGCEGPFTLYDLGSHHVVYQENAGSGVFIEEQAIELYQRVLVNLDRLALDASESNDLLTRYAKRYEHDL